MKNGITLIALVVTIVVLLILAGITINLVFSENGIIEKAREAAEKTNQAIINEQTQMNDLADYMENMLNEIGGGSSVPEIPEGLEIGSTVSYNPIGTYNWQAKYCSSDLTETTDDVQLNSATGEDFNISSWKVLSIDKNTGSVELVPSSATTGTVRLQGAQGYNNGVKLLNDACSSLYGDTTSGITARSINLEDIEKYMTDIAITEAHNYTNTDSNIKYGNQVSSPYATNKNYPAIYAQERLAVIDGEENDDTGLDLSKQDTFVERIEGTDGHISTATSIQPYQTYWTQDATFMSTAFKDYKEGANYYNLIMPSGTVTTYWVASRCIATFLDDCHFDMRSVDSGSIHADVTCTSGNGIVNYSRALFPIVTLNSSLIGGDITSGFSIK